MARTKEFLRFQNLAPRYFLILSELVFPHLKYVILPFISADLYIASIYISRSGDLCRLSIRTGNYIQELFIYIILLWELIVKKEYIQIKKKKNIQKWLCVRFRPPAQRPRDEIGNVFLEKKLEIGWSSESGEDEEVAHFICDDPCVSRLMKHKILRSKVCKILSSILQTQTMALWHVQMDK
jgi:hypothetical protein